jgi:glycerol-3-phosphate dehydrogenase
LTEAEVRWLMRHEFARAADDILWRRTKLGLRFSAAEAARLHDFMAGLDEADRTFASTGS